jgi:branched-chain amino acid transport system substrate-binding protein
MATVWEDSAMIAIGRRNVESAMALAAAGLVGLMAAITPASAADPIRIGMSLSLTGAMSPASKQVLAGLEIWRDDVNANGGPFVTVAKAAWR